MPTLFLTGAIAAALVGEEATQGGLVDRLDQLVGSDTAQQVEDAVASLWEDTDTSGFALISVLAVVWSSSVLFVAWRDMLEIVWDIPYDDGLTSSIRSRAFGMLVPIVAGLMLSAILILEVVVGFIVDLVSWDVVDTTLQVARDLLPTVGGVVALALLYRHSARGGRPAWHAVWPATIVVALLLGFASWCFGVYLQVVGSASVAGAASSVFVGLVLMYYMAQILLFGAEMIKVLESRDQPAWDTGTD